MGKLIKQTGETIKIQPIDGKLYQLNELQDLVGGWIQVIENGSELIVCNEDGKLIGLKENKEATRLYGHLLFDDDYLVGDIVVIGNSEIN